MDGSHAANGPYDGRVELVTTGDGRRIVLAGEIDMRCRDAMNAVLLQLEEQGPVDTVELADVAFLSSDGLAFLAQVHRVAAAADRVVTLHSPQRTTLRALALSGLLELFIVQPTPVVR